MRWISILRRAAVPLIVIGAIALAACSAQELAQAGYNAAKASCVQARQGCSVNDDTGAPVAPRRYPPTP